MYPGALVFDFDGLIIDTEVVHHRTVDETFRAHGVELDYALWQSFIGRIDHPHWTVLLEEQLGRPVDRAALVDERQQRYRSEVEMLPILDGVLELIDEARAAAVPMAVASSSSADWVVPHLHRLELFDRFVAVCTGDEVAAGKPSPDVYLLAVERLGVPAADSIAIEDSPTGCRAARTAGIAVVAVPSTITIGLDFDVADVVVTSATELDLAVLGRLLGRLREV